LIQLLRPPCFTLFPYTTLFRSVYGQIKSNSFLNEQIRKLIGHAIVLHLLSENFIYFFQTYSTVSCECKYSLGSGNLADSEYTARSEEHTSELQSRGHLVCRLLL